MPEKTDKKNVLFSKVGNFFRETKSEFKKIVWPTRKQITNNSIIVIIAIIVAGAAISLIDYLFTAGFNALISLFH